MPMMLSHHWLNLPWVRGPMEVTVAVCWNPEGADADQVRQWRATDEAWRVYDFLAWCVHHRDQIEVLIRQDRLRGIEPCGLPSVELSV